MTEKGNGRWSIDGLRPTTKEKKNRGKTGKAAFHLSYYLSLTKQTKKTNDTSEYPITNNSQGGGEIGRKTEDVIGLGNDSWSSSIKPLTPNI